MDLKLSTRDREIIRSLAGRVAEIAHSDVMKQRRLAWLNLNGLRGGKPLIITEHQGVPHSELGDYYAPACEGDWARILESTLKNKLFGWDVTHEDSVVEPTFNLAPGTASNGYGVESVKHRSDADGPMGSYSWDPPLKSLPEDLEKLHFREFSYDKAEWERQKAAASEVLGEFLTVQLRPWLWWSHGLTIVAIDLIGLENLMMAMYDQPEGLHALMAFLRDDHMNALTWHEEEGLLNPNNRDEYFGSGGCGYTDDLPQKDYKPGQPVRLRDMWGLMESQETVGVSPEMFEEFVLPYQEPLAARFGLVYYGCCEPVDKRLDMIRRMKNLRAVSVSPWSNVRFVAEQLKRDYVMCCKPNPALFSAPTWNVDVVRKDLRTTIEGSKGCNVQLVLKDVHTVHNQLWRYAKWVEIAREEISRVYS